MISTRRFQAERIQFYNCKASGLESLHQVFTLTYENTQVSKTFKISKAFTHEQFRNLTFSQAKAERKTFKGVYL